MNLTEALTWFFGVSCILSSLYVALSRDLFRSSIAFFVELSSVGGVLLSLNADYLAIILFAVGLLGTILVIYFAGVIMGPLKQKFRVEKNSKQSLFARFCGMMLGLSIGGAIGWAFLTAPFIEKGVPEAVTKEMDVMTLGKVMLGEQVAVFELLAVTVLLVIIGAGLLLRNPNDAK